MKRNRFLIKPFLAFMVVYLLGVFAIILAGVHYADDMGRTEAGYAVWANFSRYINEILSRFIHADNYLTNIAPLPQILAMIILAVSSVMLVCVLVGKDRFKQPWTKWFWLIVAAVPLALSPYMLECLSYQYDAVYMALSVFFVILPLVFWKKDIKYYSIAIVVGNLGVCMTYQAIVGIFPMIVIFLVMKNWGEKKECIKRAIISMIIFGLTLLVFQKFLMIPRDLYVSNSLPSLQDYIPETFKHLGQYFSLLITDFKALWLTVIVILVLIFEVLFVKNSEKSKITSVAVSLCGTLLMALCVFIIYASLAMPLFAPRAMYGVGIFLAVISVYVVDSAKALTILKVPVLILSWCFFVFALTYGNALKEQDEYRDMKIDMVMGDLNALEVMQTNNVKTIQAVGDVGKSPVITHMPQDYQILNRLLASSYSEGLIWTTYRLVYLCDMGNLKVDSGVDLTRFDLSVVKDTVYYTISADDNNILIRFK